MQRAPVDRLGLSTVSDRPDCAVAVNASADALRTTKLAAVDLRPWELDPSAMVVRTLLIHQSCTYVYRWTSKR